MHPIPSTLRALEFHGQENILASAAEALRGVDNADNKAQDARDFMAYLIDGVHGEECFEHSKSMAGQMSPAMLASANLLVANIAAVQGPGNEREGLLGYAMGRLIDEAYPSPSGRDLYSVAGILASLASMCHPGNIGLMGLLSLCKDEHHRKQAAPFFVAQEKTHGALVRPESALATIPKDPA